MRKKWICIACCFLCFRLAAQVTISVQLPPAGLIQPDQLWNLGLINNGNTTANIGLVLNLRDATTGQTVMTAAGGSLILPKGVKPISAQDIQPIQYNFYAANLPGNYLPIGSYIACYRVNEYVSDGQAPIAEECVRVQISPLSPPLLSSPADQSVLETGYPQFTWTPPAPLDIFTGLNYELLVTEVLEGQSSSEAILYNSPIYINNNLNRVFESYPAAYEKLDTGKLYAWQITARNGLNYAAQTEVWTFRIKPEPDISRTAADISFMVLTTKQEAKGINYVKGDNIYIKFYSFSRDYEGRLKLLSADGALVQEGSQKIQYGNNFLKVRLDKSFKPKTLYRVELADEQGRVYNAAFILQ